MLSLSYVCKQIEFQKKLGETKKMWEFHLILPFCDNNLLVWLKCLFTISSCLGAGEIGYSKSIVRRALEHISYIQYTVTTCIWGSMLLLHIWHGWPGLTYICQGCFYTIDRDCSIAKCVKNSVLSKPVVSFEIYWIEYPKYTHPHATSQGCGRTKKKFKPLSHVSTKLSRIYVVFACVQYTNIELWWWEWEKRANHLFTQSRITHSASTFSTNSSPIHLQQRKQCVHYILYNHNTHWIYARHWVFIPHFLQSLQSLCSNA